MKSYKILWNLIKSIKSYKIISNHIKSYQIISLSNHIKSNHIKSNLSNHEVCLLPSPHIFGINRHSELRALTKNRIVSCSPVRESRLIELSGLWKIASDGHSCSDWPTRLVLPGHAGIQIVSGASVERVCCDGWLKARRWLTSLTQSICPRLEAVVDTWRQVRRCHQTHDLVCGRVIRMTWRSYIGQRPYPWFRCRATPF